MTYLLDTLAVFILIACVIACYYKGFLKTAALFFANIIAVIASAVLSKLLAGWVYESFVKEKVISLLSDKLAAVVNVPEAVGKGLDALPKFVSNLAGGAGAVTQKVADSIAAGQQSVVEAFEKEIAGPAIILLIQVILFFILILVCSFFVKRICGLLSFVNKIPLVGPINKILGGVVGVAQGFIVVYLLTLLLTFFIGVSGDKLGFVKKQDIEDTLIVSRIVKFSPMKIVDTVSQAQEILKEQ